MATTVRQDASAAITEGLKLWPDERHQARGTLVAHRAGGIRAVCMMQMLCEGAGVSVANSDDNPAVKLATQEVLRVAGKEVRGDLCGLNNSTDFATLKGYAEEAAKNLMK